MLTLAQTLRSKLTAGVAIALAATVVLGGCAGNMQGSDGPQPAFSGAVHEQTMAAIAEKDVDAFPVSTVMNSYAVPGGNVPSWSYLFASQRYAKFYTVFNYSTKATASIYGATTWNEDDWEEAPKDVPSMVRVDADKAYLNILDEHPELRSQPYRVSFLAYEPEIEKTEDAPETMTWYFYFTDEDALNAFNSSVEHPNDIANAIVTVDARTGDVRQQG
ncbi:hypothetical protein [Arabiibacter massiliensis]|uniref:hypothetical protein n=1 Tax=Arabiibacter massiliensis TaxID=1870985 RepID=UPI0009BBB824|nr:hypothetical protein [Arabiibacter massiliensis]